jgi:hypothetical protein
MYRIQYLTARVGRLWAVGAVERAAQENFRFGWKDDARWGRERKGGENLAFCKNEAISASF